MKSLQINKQNVIIGAGQPEYQPLYGVVNQNDVTVPMTVCFKLDEEEMKQVQETGEIWLTELTFGSNFSPIGPTILRPDGMQSVENTIDYCECSKPEFVKMTNGYGWCTLCDKPINVHK